MAQIASARAVHWARRNAERVVYRVAGLPIAISALVHADPNGPASPLRSAYAADFWHPRNLSSFFQLAVAALIWPVALLASAGWFAWKNGEIVRRRCGKSRLRQFYEEHRDYFEAGILPPWYYMFELYDGRADPASYIGRFETKAGFYPLLRRTLGAESPLNDKAAFRERCCAHNIASIPVLARASGGRITMVEREHLPAEDLFVKPVAGRGGIGAERWDYCDGHYRDGDGGELDETQLIDRLRLRSRSSPCLVQPRVRNCAALDDINNGALSTVRIVTCLDERGHPEVVAAVMRMAVGDNHRVDNFHAGGIVAAVDLNSGRMDCASDLGTDSRLGWVDRHPSSGASFRGRLVPQWKAICSLARRAHRAFAERVVVGWDIAPTCDGPVVVEGNAAPDLDLIQRATRRGLANTRLGELLQHHIGKLD